jgi:glycosyltransferase involved in cell wall biosynthesis
MKLFMYHPGRNGVSFYRFWQLEKYLPKYGVEVNAVPHSNEAKMEEADHEAVLKNHDLIISNTYSGLYHSARLRAMMRRKPVIVDLDDDFLGFDPQMHRVWNGWADEPDQVDEYNPKKHDAAFMAELYANGGILQEHNKRMWVFLPGNRPKENIALQIKEAAGLSVSTETLYKLHGPHSNGCFIVPNGVDFELWHGQKNDTGKFRVGLFGSNTHTYDWKMAADGIKRFLDETPDAVLVSNYFLNVLEQGKDMYSSKIVPQIPPYFEDHFKAGRIEYHGPSEIEDYPKWLADKRVDVILAPLEKITFNKAKSNIKWLEATALGIPTIVSKLEPYAIDFYRLLKRLYSDKQERQRLAANALEVVKSKYDMAVIAANYAERLKSLEVEKCAA